MWSCDGKWSLGGKTELSINPNARWFIPSRKNIWIKFLLLRTEWSVFHNALGNDIDVIVAVARACRYEVASCFSHARCSLSEAHLAFKRIARPRLYPSALWAIAPAEPMRLLIKHRTLFQLLRHAQVNKYSTHVVRRTFEPSSRVPAYNQVEIDAISTLPDCEMLMAWLYVSGSVARHPIKTQPINDTSKH